MSEVFSLSYVEDSVTCPSSGYSLTYSLSDGSITAVSSPISFDSSTGTLTVSTTDDLEAGVYPFTITVTISLDGGATTYSEAYPITITVSAAAAPPAITYVEPPEGPESIEFGEYLSEIIEEETKSSPYFLSEVPDFSLVQGEGLVYNLPIGTDPDGD